jgi:hypothetical protein
VPGRGQLSAAAASVQSTASFLAMLLVAVGKCTRNQSNESTNAKKVDARARLSLAEAAPLDGRDDGAGQSGVNVYPDVYFISQILGQQTKALNGRQAMCCNDTGCLS